MREVSGPDRAGARASVFPLDADLDPLYDPVERGRNALIDHETPGLRFKIGVDYLTVPFPEEPVAGRRPGPS